LPADTKRQEEEEEIDRKYGSTNYELNLGVETAYYD
jgi:hypothetical protein